MDLIHDTLKKTLQLMSEEELTRNIILPLINAIHIGKIEYTHSAIEAGRDIISFGKDILGREKTLCIQVKSDKISYSATKFGLLKAQAMTAKESGVVLENGTKVFPNEVWIVSSKSFVEPDRRQVEDILVSLEKNNIKIIALDELAKLVIKKIPDVARKYSKIGNEEASRLISELSTHTESRAFGFSLDKEIEDFFVPVTIAPNTDYARYALENEILIEDSDQEASEFMIDILRTLRPIKYSELKILFERRINEKYSKVVLDENYSINIDIDIKYSVEYKKNLQKWCRWTKELAETKVLKTNKDDIKKIEKRLEDFKAHFIVHYHYEKTLNKLIELLNSLLDKCPKTLSKKPAILIALHNQLNTLDKFVEHIIRTDSDNIIGNECTEDNLIRITVPDPINILELSNLILIEGPPGCGKTTILRVIAIRLLDRGDKVLYVNCSNIKKSYKMRSLDSIVKGFCKGNLFSKWKASESVLILDGLDECSFDLSDKILKSRNSFKKIITSSRTAYKVKLRNFAFNLALAEFGNRERNLFFKKWFVNQKQFLDNIKLLVTSYTDIDHHTRLPLIATITASLIQNGYEPKTRYEIYDYRLQLMLSNWDKYRGVERIRVKDPKAKRRFLQRLAYNVHSSNDRKRTFQKKEMHIAYEESLGDWGYNHKYEDIFYDLIYSSGIIIEETKNRYSFGHLTFQEHLAGEFIFEQNHSLNSIENKMSKDWWREPLLFYASLKGDITELLNYLSHSKAIFSYTELINSMLYYAPFTSPGAKEVFNELKKSPEELIE